MLGDHAGGHRVGAELAGQVDVGLVQGCPVAVDRPVDLEREAVQVVLAQELGGVLAGPADVTEVALHDGPRQLRAHGGETVQEPGAGDVVVQAPDAVAGGGGQGAVEDRLLLGGRAQGDEHLEQGPDAGSAAPVRQVARVHPQALGRGGE
ncbi:hypothetical protein, partial [Arsenicicoccus bolidensis]|uniref:hypothetical protein n=1 Tax=Arsenicicoccus bolidensis TaxID=229480 RepID=UPI0028A7A32A